MGSPVVDIPAVDSPAARSPAAGTLAGRSPAAGKPAGDIRTAGRAVDQAIPAAVLGVPSPANLPDVVAHQSILSSGEVFLNVLAIPGA
ncbi:hypothetical protein CRM90_24525 [Mycobacterium sp. ENV421]|nr:hypothetical protein CRM90_24525 [Mycobacterium sp. ENV421]